ncbi:general secretion pathway protein GspE [Myxococcus sp. AM010]|uniref:GspE/PulE/PilB domain-containing protein n=1 Tax=Myxococcus sp. AM010 TaxID=2745138 RepID=UPI001595651E|nr:general secretion pathway protein GspE [Myxococcus sp. AM010]NVJ15995.1 general secretion pathway protein GspE [Myxococcus sp. AM010]
MKKRLGDILMERGVVDALQLHSALAYQRKWGVPLGQVVVDQRFSTPQQVLEALALQAGMQTVDLDVQPPDASLTWLIPERVAEAHRVVPLKLEGQGSRDSVLVVAIAAPASLASLDAVKSVSGKPRVVAKLASDAAIRRAIGRLYRGETGEAVPRRSGLESFSLPEADERMPMVLGGSMAELTNMEDPGGDDGLPLLSSLEEVVAQPQAVPSRMERLVQAIRAMPAEVAQPSPQVQQPRDSRAVPAGSTVGAHPAQSLPLSAASSSLQEGAHVVRAARPLSPKAPFSAQAVHLAARKRAPAVPVLTAAQPVPMAQVLVYGWGAEASAGIVRVLSEAGLSARVASTAELLAANEAQVVVAPLPSMEALRQQTHARVLVAGKTPEQDLPRAQAVGARGFLAAPVDPDLLLRAVRRLARAPGDADLKRAS